MMVWRDGSDDSYPVGPRLRDAGKKTLAELIGLVLIYSLSEIKIRPSLEGMSQWSEPHYAWVLVVEGFPLRPLPSKPRTQP